MRASMCSQGIEVAPNSIDLTNVSPNKDVKDRIRIRKKYGLPNDKPIFINGGNLGKPQGVDYIVNCLEELKNRDDCFFLIVGYGSEYEKLRQWYNQNLDKSVKLLGSLPKDDYDILVNTCDVGLIF